MRAALGADDAALCSREICQRILESSCYQAAKQIYAYAPLPGEADIREVIRTAWREHRRVALPRVCGSDMDFYEIHDFSELTSGTFGVMEPSGADAPVCWPEALVLVPGVAFDACGNRIGYGKGYYDRYLVNHPHGVTLGIGYSLQLADELPAQAHDLMLDHIVTECGFVK